MDILMVERLHFSSDYIYHADRHNDYEINYVENGRCIMNLDDQKVVLREGDCIVIPPMFLHNFLVDSKNGCTILQLIIPNRAEWIGAKERELLLFSKAGYSKIGGCYEISETMKNLIRYARKISEYGYDRLYCLEVQKLYLELSIEIRRTDENSRQYENRIFNQVFAELNENYEQDIDLQELAGKYRVSARYLRRLFEQQLGCSAIEYLTALRLEKAKRLLAESDLSVSRISLEVGYNSVQYFGKLFKKKTGISPGTFRKNMGKDVAV